VGWLATAIGPALAVTLPFLLWQPEAFFRSLVLLHLRTPFRPDALTYSAWLVQRGGAPLPAATGFAALAIGVLLGITRAARSPAGFATSIALCYAAFFPFSKQAFANYYFVVVAALCCAIAASEERA
jgi:hypothetical protein